MYHQVREQMNKLGKQKTPFLFILDYEMKQPIVLPLIQVDPEEILYFLNGQSNATGLENIQKEPEFNCTPIDFEAYQSAFKLAQKHIRYGNSFLLNLTFPSRIETNYSLKEIFARSKAKYKLWFKDRFVVFSPEIFIRTNGRKISSFPMKGTIDAQLPDAEKRLLTNQKEVAEHYTIVDLIRNDLSMVAKRVRVARFQYIDRIKTNKGELLQMSSEITGELPADYHKHLGDIFFTLLPAGSISGAPKAKTLQVIKEAEQYNRGYFTGVFGLFDGINLDSGVMIRFIEKTKNGLVYKSGGGITSQSVCKEEYEELISKIYLPFH